MRHGELLEKRQISYKSIHSPTEFINLIQRTLISHVDISFLSLTIRFRNLKGLPCMAKGAFIIKWVFNDIQLVVRQARKENVKGRQFVSLSSRQRYFWRKLRQPSLLLLNHWLTLSGLDFADNPNYGADISWIHFYSQQLTCSLKCLRDSVRGDFHARCRLKRGFDVGHKDSWRIWSRNKMSVGWNECSKG